MIFPGQPGLASEPDWERVSRGAACENWPGTSSPSTLLWELEVKDELDALVVLGAFTSNFPFVCTFVSVGVFILSLLISFCLRASFFVFLLADLFDED